MTIVDTTEETTTSTSTKPSTHYMPPEEPTFPITDERLLEQFNETLNATITQLAIAIYTAIFIRIPPRP